MTRGGGRIGVLVVDDSAFARKVVREVLSAAEGIDVLGVAHDGLEALEKISLLKPDVLAMDLVMPELDGVGVLNALREWQDAPLVVVVTMTDRDSDLGVAALEAGAFDIVQKPTAQATPKLYELGATLVAKVRAAAEAKARGRRVGVFPRPDRLEAPSPSPVPHGRVDLIVVGASTGGPQALARLLAELPSSLPVPLAIALHIPAAYTAAMAERLNAASSLDVFEAHDGASLEPGQAALARGGVHLKLVRDGARCRLKLETAMDTSWHRPSVDMLFSSAAAGWGQRTLGIVLTGMGDDGLVGARDICAAGGRVVVEAESSCVVYGMPRVIVENRLAAAEVPIERMTETILGLL